MARQRGHNEGSVTQLNDGRWQGRVTVGYKDGKQVRKAVYGKTRAEASAEVTKLLAQLQQGIAPTDDRVTVDTYLAGWLDTVQEKNEEATYVSYKGAVDLYINPVIGKVKLAKLSPTEVDRMMKEAPTVKTGNYARRVLRIALNRAIKRGDVHRNAAALTDNRRTEKHQAQFLTLDQAKALLKSVADDRHEALYAVAIALGLRKGEALGFMWRDVDLDNARLTVRQQIQRSRVTKGIVAKETKTHQIRTLDIPAFAVAALHRHRKRQLEARLLAGSRWQDTGYVFTSSIGTPIDASNLSTRFKALLKSDDLRAAGLPATLRWHELRHSAAALMLAQGATMQEVQAMLGHSQFSVTMDYYAHLMPGALRAVANRMDAAFATGTEGV
jgi:integrase